MKAFVVRDSNEAAQNLRNVDRSMGIQNRLCEQVGTCFNNNYLVNKPHKQNLVGDVL